MTYQIKRAEFVTSVADKNRLYNCGAGEIAVVGRSNVGKSSFINFICGNGKLAKTSKEPGRTRLINYFTLNDGEIFFVDLPGYGFARVNDGEKRKWSDLIEGYFKLSLNIKNVFLLLDIRREPNDDDIMMVNYLHHYAIPFTVITTKADKVSRAECNRLKGAICTRLALGKDNVITTSALSGQGKEQVLERIGELVARQKETSMEASRQGEDILAVQGSPNIY